VNKDLSLLIKLQSLDTEISKKEKKKDVFSQQIEEIEGKIEILEKELVSREKELKQIKKEKRKKEREIEDIDLLLSKYEGEKYKVKSQGEFAALEKEINEAKKNKTKIEDILLELMEKEEKDMVDFPSFKKGAAEKKENLKKKRDTVVINLENTTKEEKDLKNERVKLTSQLNFVLLNQYTQLSKGKKGPIVVPMEDGVCEGCNMRVSPSLMGKIKKGEEIVYCENCSRILYTLDNIR